LYILQFLFSHNAECHIICLGFLVQPFTMTVFVTTIFLSFAPMSWIPVEVVMCNLHMHKPERQKIEYTRSMVIQWLMSLILIHCVCL